MKVSVLVFILVAVAHMSPARADAAGAPVCEGFPWTVSAIPAGATSIAVQIC